LGVGSELSLVNGRGKKDTRMEMERRERRGKGQSATSILSEEKVKPVVLRDGQRGVQKGVACREREERKKMGRKSSTLFSKRSAHIGPAGEKGENEK